MAGKKVAKLQSDKTVEIPEVRGDGGWKKKVTRLKIPTLLLLLLFLFWYKTNSWPIAAIVNYQPVWRWEMDRIMYNQVGKQALDNLVVEKLIADELAEKKIKVNLADVDARIEEIKKQVGSGESFEQALAFQGLSVEQLKKQIGLQLGLEKLVEPSTDSAILQERVYDLVQQLRGGAKVWIPTRSGD